jgi:hypothetical protein
MGIRKCNTVATGREEWWRIEWGSRGPQGTVALEEEEQEEKEEEKNFMQQFLIKDVRARY